MTRRSFILLTGLGISTMGVLSAKFFNLDFIDNTPYVKPRLLSQLCNDDTIRLLGHSYLELRPAERNRDRLMKEIYGRVVNIATLRRRDILRMRAQLRNSIRKNFASRETVILRGWILSLTEARQCALFFILSS
jgi:hypothetical protein